MERISAFDKSTLADSHNRRHDAHVSTVAQQLHKLGRRPRNRPTDEHDMLQPVDGALTSQRAQRLLEEIGSHM